MSNVEAPALVDASLFADRSTNNRPTALCLYHANCMDGLISAAIVNLFYRGNVECVAVHYKDEVPAELIADRNVYLVDFTFTPDEILPHLESMRSLTIIDHHDKAMRPWVAMAESNDYPSDKLKIFYDGKRSGAGLVWRHFYAKEGSARSSDMPILVQYAQEYDLWTKAFANTDEVQSGLRYMFPPREAKLAELGDFLVRAGKEEVEELHRIGTIILRQEMIQVEALVKRGLMFADFAGHSGVAVCACPPELANQLGELVYTRYPDVPFVVMFEDNYKHGTRKYSFRSRKNGGTDVEAIAVGFGGSGHTNSSGALVKREFTLV